MIQLYESLFNFAKVVFKNQLWAKVIFVILAKKAFDSGLFAFSCRLKMYLFNHFSRSTSIKIFRKYKPNNQPPIIKNNPNKNILKNLFLRVIMLLRKILAPMGTTEAMEFLLDKMKDTKTNNDFFQSMGTKS